MHIWHEQNQGPGEGCILLPPPPLPHPESCSTEDWRASTGVGCSLLSHICIFSERQRSSFREGDGIERRWGLAPAWQRCYSQHLQSTFWHWQHQNCYHHFAISVVVVIVVKVKKYFALKNVLDFHSGSPLIRRTTKPIHHLCSRSCEGRGLEKISAAPVSNLMFKVMSRYVRRTHTHSRCCWNPEGLSPHCYSDLAGVFVSASVTSGTF